MPELVDAYEMYVTPEIRRAVMAEMPLAYARKHPDVDVSVILKYVAEALERIRS